MSLSAQLERGLCLSQRLHAERARMAASNFALVVIADGQFGNRPEASSVCIQSLIDMKVQLQIMSDGRIKHALQFCIHIGVFVHECPQ